MDTSVCCTLLAVVALCSTAPSACHPTNGDTPADHLYTILHSDSNVRIIDESSGVVLSYTTTECRCKSVHKLRSAQHPQPSNVDVMLPYDIILVMSMSITAAKGRNMTEEDFAIPPGVPMTGNNSENVDSCDGESWLEY
ncbi:hypothetical protein EVAR_53132_1 [Eumeta japonica]|uniref:Uncharacterized protein n=1 Tax=Eumeta variegata TaxID=151549 RepID=A0A4C1YFW1_EUMVA|nr:hypothetical protein EVAR_53132_1 [Eumeta japonica]